MDKEDVVSAYNVILLGHKKEVYMGKNGFSLGSTKPEVVRNTPQIGTGGKTFTEKR